MECITPACASIETSRLISHLVLLFVVSFCNALPKHFVPIGSSSSNYLTKSPEKVTESVDDEVKTTPKLTSEQRLNRLAAIFDKIDKDSNGLLTQDELSEWIHWVSRNNIERGTRRQWSNHNPYGKSRLSWPEYRKSMYGIPLSWSEDRHPQQDERGEKVNKLIKNDRMRWSAADRDSDDLLDVEEFEAFVYPEEKEHMVEIVAKETLEAVDKNGDGIVDINEYIQDVFPDIREGPWPDYVKEEVELFRKHRDSNGDGHLDLQEMIAYTKRSENEHPEAESIHLINSADEDHDGLLSKTEVLKHYDVFVGGQVTDYGEAIWRHDEF